MPSWPKTSELAILGQDYKEWESELCLGQDYRLRQFAALQFFTSRARFVPS
jgi:hypothetical protein